MNKNYLNHLNKLMEGSIEDIIEVIDQLNAVCDERLEALARKRNMLLTANKETKAANIIINKGKVVKITEEKIIDNTDYDRIKVLEKQIAELEKQTKEDEAYISSLRKEIERHLQRIFDLTSPQEKEEETVVEDTKEYENAYCGECMECTDQEIVNNGAELKCTQCGQLWERFVDEKEETVEENEEGSDTIKIEYISHRTLKDDKGFEFLYTYTDGNETVEFTALAQEQHKYPIVYDARPNDMELLEVIKNDINSRVGIYNRLDNDIIPDYRYHRGDELFIYFDEAAEVFKGYYCGNGKYDGRAFVFDIKDKNGPCSRGFRQLVKDHKSGKFGAFTTMNGKGQMISVWQEIIINECRDLYKLSKNADQITRAKAIAEKPWKAGNEVQFNQALRFLAQMNVSYNCEYKTYAEAIDSELRHISQVRASGNNNYGKSAQKKFQDRIHELKLTNLYLQNSNTKDNSADNNASDPFADVEL